MDAIARREPLVVDVWPVLVCDIRRDACTLREARRHVERVLGLVLDSHCTVCQIVTGLVANAGS